MLYFFNFVIVKKKNNNPILFFPTPLALKHSPSKRKSLSQQQPTSLVQRVLGANRQAMAASNSATAASGSNGGGVGADGDEGPSTSISDQTGASPHAPATSGSVVSPTSSSAPGPSSTQGKERLPQYLLPQPFISQYSNNHVTHHHTTLALPRQLMETQL